MLQSEFFERTKVNLTGEDYADVEKLYNSVRMDKDAFCKHWLKLRNNQLFIELAEAFRKADTFGRLQNDELKRTNKEMAEKEELHKQQLDEQRKSDFAHIDELVKSIIIANEESNAKVYDTIEEEYGIGFIIKTKHENGIPLSEEEINYMVGKL